MERLRGSKVESSATPKHKHGHVAAREVRVPAPGAAAGLGQVPEDGGAPEARPGTDPEPWHGLGTRSEVGSGRSHPRQ